MGFPLFSPKHNGDRRPPAALCCHPTSNPAHSWARRCAAPAPSLGAYLFFLIFNFFFCIIYYYYCYYFGSVGFYHFYLIHYLCPPPPPSTAPPLLRGAARGSVPREVGVALGQEPGCDWRGLGGGRGLARGRRGLEEERRCEWRVEPGGAWLSGGGVA